MHVIFPLLSTVLTIERRMKTARGDRDTANDGLLGFNKIHIPNTGHESLKSLITLYESANKVMIINELLKGNRLICLESMFNIMMSSEHVEEFKADIIY